MSDAVDYMNQFSRWPDPPPRNIQAHSSQGMLVALTTTTQAQFYREFLMARGFFDPKEFGVDATREDFHDQMAEDFNSYFRGQWSIDELLLHPRDAIRFCDEVRHKRHYFDVPDDIILRSILTRRKNPGRLPS